MENYFFNQTFIIDSELRVSVSSWVEGEAFVGSFAVKYLKNGKWELNTLSIRDSLIKADGETRRDKLNAIDRIRAMMAQQARIYIELTTRDKFGSKAFNKRLIATTGKPVIEIAHTI